MKRFLVVAILAIVPVEALAQSCTFTNTGLAWGNINLAANVNYDITGTFTASCAGIANRTVRVCPNFNAGSGGVNSNGSNRYALNGPQQLRYNIYRNSGRSQVWGSRTWGLSPTPPTINVSLNSAGTGSASQIMYGRVYSGQTTVPPGIHISSFAGVQTQIAYAYSTVGTCAAIGLAHSTAVPFPAAATYTGTCAVTATTLDFGTRGVLSANVDATNTISVTCTAGGAYTIGLGGGNAGATDPTQRRMLNGGQTEFVTYGIYRDVARSLPWGETIGTNTASGTGTGMAQNYTAYGRVPAQTTPSPQLYADTIVVTVTY